MINRVLRNYRLNLPRYNHFVTTMLGKEVKKNYPYFMANSIHPVDGKLFTVCCHNLLFPIPFQIIHDVRLLILQGEFGIRDLADDTCHPSTKDRIPGQSYNLKRIPVNS